MKRIVISLIIIGMLLLVTTPVFAQPDNFTAAYVANYSGDYTQVNIVVLNTTILNNTIFGSGNATSGNEVYVRVALNLTTNGTNPDENLTLSEFNLTLGDQWEVNDTTKIKLLNASYGFMMYANGTVNDPNAPGYTEVWFNAPNITGAGVGDLWIDGGVVGTGEGWYLTNKTWMTMFLEYRLQPLNLNRTVSQTVGQGYYIDNVSYGGYSDMKPPIILQYTPQSWVPGGSRINEVDYAYASTTNYSFDSTNIWLYYPSDTKQAVGLAQNYYTYLTMYYYAQSPVQSGQTWGTTTAPATSTMPTLTASANLMTTYVVAITAVIITVVVGAGIYFYRKK